MKKREKIEFLVKNLDKMFPDSKTELNYENPYQLLIAVIMSAQTTDKQVNKANKKFFKIVKSPDDAIRLWEDVIKKYISSIGFFNTKAKNIYKSSLILKNKRNNQIPRTLKDLQELPWVGIKTAKVVWAVLYDMPVLAVDTHVHRVLNRIWIVKTKSPLETDKIAEKVLKNNTNRSLHNSLILFWRYHCKARSPECEKCPMSSICDFYIKK